MHDLSTAEDAVPRLRFGLLVNSRQNLADWQRACLDDLLGSGLAEAAVVVVPAGNASGSRASRGSLGFRLWQRLSRSPESARRRPFPPELETVPVLDTETRRLRKFHRAFPPETVGALRELELDFMLRFGFGVIGGEVLSAARYGVWSFHHGDEREFRGRPSGFWEIYTGAEASGGMLQRLTEAIDGGVVLKRWRVKTESRSWRENIDRIRYAGVWAPRQVCWDVLRDQAAYVNAPAEPITAPHRFLPTNWQTLRGLLTMGRARARARIRGALYREKWAVGVFSQPLQGVMEEPDWRGVRWITPPNRDFLADPILEAATGDGTALAEYWEWSSRRGRLVRVDLATGSWQPVELPGDTGGHVSYPLTFEHRGRRYLLPEMRRTGEVRLYPLCEQGRLSEPIVIAEADLGDPTLLAHADRFWLFGEEKPGHLHIWFSERLTDGWRPHPKNPVLVDTRSARPAGPVFSLDGALIRPAQDGVPRYGSGIVFKQIEVLTPDDFRESEVGRLGAGPRQFTRGVHTVSSQDGITLVDGRAWVFDPLVGLRRLSDTLKRRPA